MPTPQTHQITVNLTPAALQTLLDAGASLYALPMFQTSNRTARPLVTYANAALSQSQNLAWTEVYQAFVSRTALAAGITDPAQRTIVVGASAPTRLGDVMTVGASLQCVVAGGGGGGAVSIQSAITDPLSCGLSYDGRPACAMGLSNALQVTVAPLQSLLLMFSTSVFDLGAWVEQCAGPGLLVDMTNTATRTVTYDLTAADPWLDADKVWATAIADGAPLADLLRQPPPRNMPQRK
ncbi:hypothetical protein [Phenylobacterium sp.]|uniref:hypothetical protein n=1 Tax=Phenylobacterium sp. TaxID=1871053 RepID=UPI002869FAE4|nr:hypothetical protein [Phenylobacterium sp.]